MIKYIVVQLQHNHWMAYVQLLIMQLLVLKVILLLLLKHPLKWAIHLDT